MFGKSFRDNPKPETPSVPDLKLPENLSLNKTPKEPQPFTESPLNQPTRLETEIDTVETVEIATTVEKISRIVSPYFIAVVGLSLYEDNFFLGTILISVGILSLLKVTTKDVAVFLEWIKGFLGFGDEETL